MSAHAGASQFRGVLRPLALAATLVGAWVPSAKAQEFSLYLKCEGVMEAPNRQVPAFIDFALRFASRQALIQRSNILPAGYWLAYEASPASFSMVLRLDRQGTQVIAFPGWLTSSILILQPNLNRLNQIRLGIDRKSGQLDGQVLNEQDERLTSFTLNCRALSEGEMADRKF